MCTVTFLPLPHDNFILTSNRDEAPQRQTLMPTRYFEMEQWLWYPKDMVAGGTWIGISGRKRAVTLMNGAFEAHKRLPEYAKSRGQVVKEFLTAQNLEPFIEKYDFTHIEPFTTIIVDYSEKVRLLVAVWDGNRLYMDEPLPKPTIWSSSPLYPSALREKRQKWFSEFVQAHPHHSSKEILQFHNSAGEGDPSSNLIMDRGVVRTKSITQISGADKTISMYYKDIQNLQEKHITIEKDSGMEMP